MSREFRTGSELSLARSRELRIGSELTFASSQELRSGVVFCSCELFLRECAVAERGCAIALV